MAPSSSIAQSYPPAWSASSHYAIGDQVQEGGNIYRAIKAVTASGGPTVDYTDWELYFVRSNTTLMIGAGESFPTLAAAWTYIVNARVADGAYVHLYISTANGNFSETFTAPFLLDHSSGARIALIGEAVGSVSLNFSNTNGFIVDTGHSFNTISGVTLTNSTENNGNDGLKADLQASVSAVSNVAFSGFNADVHATQNATVSVGADSTFAQYNTALWAETGGSIVTTGPLSIDSPLLDNSGYAVEADNGGEINAEQSLSVSHSAYGVLALDGGIVILNSLLATGNSFACVASQRGDIFISSGFFSANSFDLDVTLGGLIVASGIAVNQILDDGVAGSYIEN
jgi:hypothetical protein